MKNQATLSAFLAIFLALALILVAQPDSSLPNSSPAMKSVLTQVITQQIEAFRANDYARAYTFASSDLRKIFPADTFAQMVQAGYPLIAHSTTSDFGVALDNGEEGVVFVRVGDAQGAHQIYRYTLRLEPDGWKITGVSQADPSSPPKSSSSPFTA